MRHATRPPLERIAELDRAIRAGQYPNAGSVAERMELSPRTIQRDIDFMRDRLGAPLAYDARRRGYRYTDPTYRLPFWTLTEGELVAIFLAERVLRQWGGTPYGPDLERAFRKMTAALGEAVTIDLGELGAAFSVRATAEAPFDPALFRNLTGAVLHRRRVVLDYDSATSGRSQRAIDPYHLAQVDGSWYLVGHCHLRGEIRMFAPGRIRALEVTEETFAPPEGFRIEEYLAGSLAVLRGGPGEVYRVRLRFTGSAARYVAERVWHPSQVAEHRTDNELVLAMELGHLREVERWVLSWGPDCEALEPPELRERIQAALERTLTNYRSPPGPRRHRRARS
ncbi:helix-turn-helix transcriptional regulator [Tautonia sociabilis]|uniref:WYL domain-containing protein n=1 Tax=Tautonia sociabilis TaxID=2080755 RepID=A0A432MCV5_9BACT|nr:WYL domain-containing protein [Tautonia sociabilis]RUL82181.1 WYL domain-containing protein [Tautonia sociabilis]